MTLIELLTQSLLAIGVARPNQSLSSTQTTNAKNALNLLVDEWNADGLLVPSVTREYFTMTPSQASYTWGTAGNFNSARPINIRTIFVRDGGLDYPVDIISQDEYEDIVDKTEAGRPEKVWINRTYPTMTLYFYFVPDAAYTLYADSEKDIIDFNTLTATISLPPEYLAALKWNLAAELWTSYFPNVGISAKVEMRARETLETLRRNNLAAKTNKVNLPVFSVRQGTRGNIFTGWD